MSLRPCLLIFLILSVEAHSIMTDPVTIRKVLGPFEHAEGPHWEKEENCFYFVDISGFAIHRYEPITGLHTYLTLNDTVGVVIPIKGEKGNFIIGYGRDITRLAWDGHSNKYSIKTLFTVDEDKTGNRFNDGKSDQKGNLWIGTMGEERPVGVVAPDQGSLYVLRASDCSLSRALAPVSISNGIAWASHQSTIYYIDSPTRRVDSFTYHPHTAAISDRKVFFDFEKNGIVGVPDGMTIDSDDNLWIACWGGSKVIQVCGRSGKLLRGVEMPAERVTSVAFGGPDLATLLVTTMRTGLSQDQLAAQPLAGSVFAVTGLGVTGVEAHSVDLQCLTQT